MQKPFIKVTLAIAILAFAVIGVNNIVNTNHNVRLRHLEIKSKDAQLLELSDKYDEVLNKKAETLEEKKQQSEKIKELEAERERLQRELQAKLKRQAEERQRLARASQNASGTAVASAQSTRYSGNKQTWLIASGIPQNVWWAVDSIVSGESGWNPNAVNPTSGACGLGQQLPCGKWGGDWRDPVHALKSMHTYVQAYGGWVKAVEFRNCTGTCWSNRTNSYVYKSHTWY
jgi:glutamine synthetase adenylyltransferase